MIARIPPLSIAVLLSCGLHANEMNISGTPVLTASLDSGWAWQVESSSPAGGPWTPTGILVAGSASPVSVRLDGFPADHAYRFRSHDLKYEVTPSLVRGWHLAGIETDVKQVIIDASSDLAGWTQQTVVFPDASGNYVRAIREPLSPRAFFRSIPAVTLLESASVTSYGPADPNTGTSGFGPVKNEMPLIYQNGLLAAVHTSDFNRGGIPAAASGECYELSGPAGRATVMVNEVTSTALVGTIDAGREYMDLSDQAFGQIAGPTSIGIAAVTRRLVPAPVIGNLKLFVVINAGGFYTELRPYNHRAGVNQLEIKNHGSSTWTPLPRTSYNSFVHNGAALVFPLSVRITSRFGEVIELSGIPSMTSGDRLSAASQFTTFPPQAPEPVQWLAPVYQDGFSTVPGDSWSGSGYGGTALNANSPAAAYSGSSGLEITGLAGFNGVTFSHNTPFARPDQGLLTFAIRSSSTTPAHPLAIRVNGSDSTGAPATSSLILLPSLTDTWQVFRLPLNNSGIPPVVSSIELTSRSPDPKPAVWMDDIRFIPH